MSVRRIFVLLWLVVVAFAAVSLGHVSGASAEPPRGEDEGIKIDCRLGTGWVEPGTMIDLPAAGDLPPVTYICGDDGKWHKTAKLAKPPATVAGQIVAPPPILKSDTPPAVHAARE